VFAYYRGSTFDMHFSGHYYHPRDTALRDALVRYLGRAAGDPEWKPSAERWLYGMDVRGPNSQLARVFGADVARHLFPGEIEPAVAYLLELEELGQGERFAPTEAQLDHMRQVLDSVLGLTLKAGSLDRWNADWNPRQKSDPKAAGNRSRGASSCAGWLLVVDAKVIETGRPRVERRVGAAIA
jgi:hypothetical protein